MLNILFIEIGSKEALIMKWNYFSMSFNAKRTMFFFLILNHTKFVKILFFLSISENEKENFNFVGEKKCEQSIKLFSKLFSNTKSCMKLEIVLSLWPIITISLIIHMCCIFRELYNIFKKSKELKIIFKNNTKIPWHIKAWTLQSIKIVCSCDITRYY